MPAGVVSVLMALFLCGFHRQSPSKSRLDNRIFFCADAGTYGSYALPCSLWWSSMHAVPRPVCEWLPSSKQHKPN